MVDLSRYQPPGVYVEEDVTTLAAPTGVSPVVVALVGPARGYRQFTEAVTLTGSTVVTLAQTGIDTASVSVAAADGTVHPPTDYSLSSGPGSTVTIARNGTGIVSGTTVYVSYNYTDASYFLPQQFIDYGDVKAAYGEPMDTTTGEILSPLSLAAKFAFDNGARILMLTATNGASDTVTRSELQDAYDALSGTLEPDIVVPIMPGISGSTGAPSDSLNVAEDLQSHVESMSANGLYRIGIIGYDSGVTEDPATMLASFRSPRVVLAWPNRLNFFNGYANADVEVGGYYLAAAIAGMVANLPVNVPLTKKVVRSFSGLPASVLQAMTLTQKNAWSSAGVAVAEISRNGALVVRHGVTTQIDNITHRELSLVRAKDALVTMIESTVEAAGLVGSPIDDHTPFRVKSVIAGCLETAVGADIIVAYRSLLVRPQPSGDPSVIEVKFQYVPAYPLNYIDISFSIDTTTGITDITTLAA